jgi:hypothetical protein
MDREDTKSRSAPAGGSGGGTHDRWTEEDFKQRVRERLDRIEQHLDRIDQRLYRRYPNRPPSTLPWLMCKDFFSSYRTAFKYHI